MKNSMEKKSLAEQLKDAVIDRFVMFLTLNMCSDFGDVLDNPKFQDVIKKTRKDIE